MPLTRLSVSEVRCVEEAELEIAPHLTLISGPNAAGKTSLLEAAYLLGRGRSFRTRNNEKLISYGKDLLRVTGEVSPATEALSEVRRSLGIEVTRCGTTARVAGQNVRSLAALAQEFPVQVIDPGIHRLVEEGSYGRRRWLDWAVFHVEPPFAENWSRYTRALRQRNAALRTTPGDAAFAWDAELARLGEAIAASRERVMRQLETHWHETVATLSGLDVELHHQRGWRADQSLAEALAQAHNRDTARGLTHVGPHRADVAIRLLGRPARDVLSRGQQKLVASGMAVAQLRLLEEVLSLHPTLLLDDPAAELDGDRLQRFIGAVGTLRCQLIVTSLEPGTRLFGMPERAFHVGQGRVRTV